MQRVAEYAAALPPGAWIYGGRWNESRWNETDFLTAADLDPVTGPDHPTLLARTDGHGAVANSAALALAGIDADTPNPPGGVIDHGPDGKPTGFLRELAIDLVERYVPQPSEAAIDAALLRRHARRCNKLGVTAVHAQRVKDSNDGTQEWPGLLRLREKGELKLRVSCNIAAHHLPARGGARPAHRLWRPVLAHRPHQGLYRRQSWLAHGLAARALCQAPARRSRQHWAST